MKTTIFIVIIIIILAIWLYIGYRNYKTKLKVIEEYIEFIDNLYEAEAEEQDTMEKSLLFNYRENMINKNLVLEGIRLEMKEDEKSYKRSLFWSYLFLGPLYNIK